MSGRTPRRRSATECTPPASFTSSFSSVASDSKLASLGELGKRKTGSSGEQQDDEPCRVGLLDDERYTSEDKWQIGCFWLAGLLNNSSYVIMIAAAKEIISGGVGLVFLAGTVPSFLVSTTAPYWFHRVPYGIRFVVAGLLMCGSYLTVALAPDQTVALIGVVFASIQGGLGEPSFLALASLYRKKEAYLTAWSSGTGFAGVFGYGWLTFLHQIGGLSFRDTMLIANSLAVCWLVGCHWLVVRPPGVGWYCRSDEHRLVPGEAPEVARQESFDEGEEEDDPVMTSCFSRFRFVVTKLWPYTIPLVVVYVSEYAMQSGCWAAIGFPVHEKSARDKFYLYGNFCYQGGVFVSRSSGMLFRANRATLWAMPALQAALLVFFYTDAQWQYWYDWGLLGPCVMSGLLGGAVYVNALTLICAEVEPKYQEFSLTAVATAFSLGIVIANGVGLIMQCELYKVHSISGASLSC